MRRLDYIAHHGILGQKWGIRRYQNPDGSLTEAGKKHYHPNYSAKQRRQDAALYGRRGVERINREMHRGNSILGARHYEVARKERNASIKRGAKKVAALGVGAHTLLYALSPDYRNTINSGVQAAGKYAVHRFNQVKSAMNNDTAKRQAAKNLRRWKVR